MSNVTFSSPVMARDMTVYAVAGDRGTILAVAKSHKIPIPFDCQDGESADPAWLKSSTSLRTTANPRLR